MRHRRICLIWWGTITRLDPPSKGPGPAQPPHDEVFAVGEDTIEATGGQSLIATAGAPYKFLNVSVLRYRRIRQ